MVNKFQDIFVERGDKEEVFMQSGLLLEDFPTFSKCKLCPESKLERHQGSIDFQGAQKDRDKFILNSLLRDFVEQRLDKQRVGKHPQHESEYRELVRDIVLQNIDVNVRDAMHQTPLHLAVKYGHLEMIEHLLGRGALIEATDYNGMTALHLAASLGNCRVTELLLQRDANPCAKTQNGLSPLFFAVKSGCVELVELLASRPDCDVNELVTDPDLHKKYTYLHKAVEMNHAQMVEVLLQKNADPNLRDGYGSTALHLATRHGRVSIVELLLNHGAGIHERDCNELTALYLALDVGHKDVFELLLRRGANVNDRGTAGASLLHLAVKLNDPELVSCLLRKGVEVNAVTRFHKTALYVAIVERNWLVLELLLEHGADPAHKDILGKTILHSAVELRRREGIELLLRHGADPNVRDDVLQTPLHAAVRQGCLASAELLLRHGANPNVEDNMCQTPLHLAVKYGHVRLFEPLHSHGANIDAADVDGQTALHLAILSDRVKLVYLLPNHTFFACLLGHGADVHGRTLWSGETPLHLAVRNRCLAFLRGLLWRGAEVNVPERLRRRTALHMAVENADVNCLEQLLVFGADVELLDEDGHSPADLATVDAVTRTFARHFVKRAIAGFRLGPIATRLADEDTDENYRNSCQRELDRMMLTRMYDDLTYYDFLRGTRRSLVGFVRDERLVALFTQHRPRMAFPIYADLLERNFVWGRLYAPIIEPARKSLAVLCGNRLPSVPFERLLGYLDESDMRNVLKAVPRQLLE